MNTDIYDEVISVSNADAFDTAKLIAKKEGILVGISSGAAVFQLSDIPDTYIRSYKNMI